MQHLAKTRRTPRTDGRAAVWAALIVALALIGAVSFLFVQQPAEPLTNVESSEEAQVEEEVADDANSEAASPVALNEEAAAESDPVSADSTGKLVVRGTVRDAAGEPLAGVLVRWIPGDSDWLDDFRYDGKFLQSESVPSLGLDPDALEAFGKSIAARTGADGTYRLELAGPKWVEASVVATRSGYRADSEGIGSNRFGRLPQGRGVGAAEVRQALEVARQVAKEEEVEATTKLERVIDFELVTGGMVSGFVRNTAGEPATGMVVRALVEDAADDSAMAWLRDDEGPRATVGEDGSYAIVGLKSADYKVTLRTGDSAYIPQTRAPHKIFLEAGESVTELNFVAKLGGTLEGRVVGASGEPIAGAEVQPFPSGVVMWQSNDPDLEDLMDREAEETADDGTFVIRGMPLDKTYGVAVSREGFAMGKSGKVELTEAAPRATVEVELVRGSTISGTVTNPDGSLAAEVRVSAMPEMSKLMDGSMMGGMGANLFGHRTDEQGRFSIPHLTEGKYTLSAGSRSNFNPFGQQEGVLEVEVDGVEDVTGVELVAVVEDEEEDQPEPGSGTISGRVVDDRGEPVANAKVTTGVWQTESQADTDENGNFVVEVKGNPPFSVEAEKKGHKDGEAGRLEIGDRNVEIVLERFAVVRGRVLLPDGGVPPSCKISYREVGVDTAADDWTTMIMGGDSDWTEGEEDGSFVLDDVGPGRIEILAVVPGYAKTASEPIEVPAGGEHTGVFVTVSRGASIVGKVLLTSGELVSGASVTLAPYSNSESARLMRRYMPTMYRDGSGETTDEQGLFEMDRLSAGEYEIFVSHPKYAPSEPVRVSVGLDQQLNLKPIRLSVGGVIEGTVTSGDKGRGGVMIQMMGDAPMAMATTDSEGRYRFEGVRPGEYMLNVMDMSQMASGSMAMRINAVTVNGEETVVHDIDFSGGVAVFGKISGLATGGMHMISLRRPGGPNPEDIDPVDVAGQIEAARYTAGMTMVGADGNFRIDGVEPGEYILEVPYVPSNPMDIEGQRSADRTPSYRKKIEVEGEDLEHDIQVRKTS